LSLQLITPFTSSTNVLLHPGGGIDPRGGGQALVAESFLHSDFKILLLPAFSLFLQYPYLLQKGAHDGQSQSLLQDPGPFPTSTVSSLVHLTPDQVGSYHLLLVATGGGIDPRGGGEAVVAESFLHSDFKILLLPVFSLFLQYP